MNALAPLEVEVAAVPHRIVLTDLRYCGVYPGGAAKILAVGLRPTPGQAVAPHTGVILDANLSRTEDCGDPLSAITMRAGFPARGVAAFLRAAWKPWILHVSIEDIRIPSQNGGIDGLLSWPGVDVPTRPLTVALGSGQLPIAVAFGFHAKAIAARLIIDGEHLKDVKTADLVPPPPDAVGVGFPPELAMRASVDLEDLNSVSARYFRLQPLKVTTGTPVIGEFNLTSLTLTALDASEVAMAGAATLGAVAFDLTVNLKGEDLAVEAVGARPRHETCPNEPLARISCMARNLALDATAGQLSAVATAAYSGRLLRSLGRPGLAAVKFGQLVCDIEPIVERVDSTAKKVVVDANLIFHRPAN